MQSSRLGLPNLRDSKGSAIATQTQRSIKQSRKESSCCFYSGRCGWQQLLTPIGIFGNVTGNPKFYRVIKCDGEVIVLETSH